MASGYDHYKNVPNLPEKFSDKKKKPKIVAFVDEDNCTGCLTCVPFCPVNCIEPVPVTKYNIPIPPVQIRFNECIGCSVCARVCTKLTWDAIEMVPVAQFEAQMKLELTDSKTPPYGIPKK